MYSNQKRLLRSGMALSALTQAALALAAPPAPATLPVGGQVVAGQAQIGTSGTVMTIRQSSSRAAIDWQRFDIGAQAQVDFVQPGADSVSGHFSDKNAASGKTVSITGLSLGGPDAGNYSLAQTSASTTADITPAGIGSVGGFSAKDKVYDGTRDAELDISGLSFTGMLPGDQLSVTGASGQFSDKNAGSAKPVSISGLVLSGADAGNYTLGSSTATASASIGRAVIGRIDGIAAKDKTYDGNAAATLDLASASFSGMVAGDQLLVPGAEGRFSDKNAASGKTVSISGLSLGGADAGNYSLAITTASTTASIGPAPITAVDGITVLKKPADGTTSAQLDLSQAQLSGVLGADTVLLAQASGQFDNPLPGRDKPVAITQLALGGADAGNYRLALQALQARGEIESSAQPPAPVQLPAPVPVPAAAASPPGPPSADASAPPGTISGAAPTMAPSAASGGPTPINLALGLQAAASAVSGGITVTLQAAAQNAATGPAATIAVVVPHAIAQQAQGFNFPLPDAVRQRVQQALAAGSPVLASGAEGEPLPGWLRFDPESLRFIATNVPAGALPYQARLSFGGQDVRVVVSEDGS